MNASMLQLRAPGRAAGLCFAVEDGGCCEFNAGGAVRSIESARLDGWVGLIFNEPIHAGEMLNLQISCRDGQVGEEAGLPIGETVWLPLNADMYLGPSCDSVPPVMMEKMRALVWRRRVMLQGIRYFRALDACTNSSYAIPAPSDTSDTFGNHARTLSRGVWQYMPELGNVLFGRIHERRAAASRTGLTDKLAVYDRDRVEQVSSVMLLLLSQYFGGLETGEHVDAIGLAHDMFAWGELKQPTADSFLMPEAAPDSAAIILYPEFAQMAIDMEIHPQYWTRLLPILTRMADLYVFAYESSPRGWSGPQAFAQYVGLPSQRAPREQLIERSKLLQAKYRIMTRDELGVELGALARRAFTDEWPFHQKKSQAA